MTSLHLRGVVLPGEETRDLWVVNGRIRLNPVPYAQTVVDGGFLVPGLVDAHCHIGISPSGDPTLDEAAQQAEVDRDSGALLVRDCGVPIDTRPLQERLDLPRIVRSGRHISAPKRYIRYLGVEVEDPQRLPEVVAEQAAYGDGWVKLVGDWIDRSTGDLAPLWPDDVLAKAIDVAHQAGARVTAHVFGEDAIPGLLAGGIDCVEHGTGLTAGTIATMAGAGTALVPTMINIETFPALAAQASKYPKYAAHMLKLHEGVRDTVRTAIEAGVSVYAGTDAGGGIEHGRLVDEIEALHGAGMTRTQALAAGSWAARGWLGYSSFEDGSAADIVAYQDDPREDLTALRSPARIVLRGRIVR